jgi:(p)ppGpp synthase/HD superfamily hydrolase
MAANNPAYYETIEALEWAKTVHTGMRKDGVTPEFQHQLQIAHYVRTLHTSLIYPAETLTAVLYHDLKEDYPELTLELQSRCSDRVFNAVKLLDKNGKTHEAYFHDLATDCIGSVAKGGDRIHNLQTMVGVFSPEKQLAYVEEVELHFLPMLKEARRRFPRQEPAYENIKHVLTTQVELIRSIHIKVES